MRQGKLQQGHGAGTNIVGLVNLGSFGNQSLHSLHATVHSGSVQGRETKLQGKATDRNNSTLPCTYGMMDATHTLDQCH
jgi:hypothetical protein